MNNEMYLWEYKVRALSTIDNPYCLGVVPKEYDRKLFDDNMRMLDKMLLYVGDVLRGETYTMQADGAMKYNQRARRTI